MTPREVLGEIQRATQTLWSSGIAVDFNTPVIRSSGNKAIVTWASAPVVLTDSVFATISEYRRLVIARQYTCALRDGALVQISYSFDGANVVSNRFCYYPCPLALSAESWDPNEGSFLDLFDDLLLEEFSSSAEDLLSLDEAGIRPHLMLRGPIRFDYAPNQAAPGHSASHLHFGTEETRLPVFGPLSIGHFLRFVIRHFYPDVWTESAAISTSTFIF